MLSIEEYESLGASPASASDEQYGEAAALAVLIDQVGAVFFAFDDDLRIRRANRDAVALAGLPPERMIGRRIEEIFPQLEGGPLLARLRILAQTGNAFDIELPSEVRSGRTVEVHGFRFPGGCAILSRDIADAESQRRATAEAITLASARRAHGAVGTARLSVRATFETVEPIFASLAGFAALRLTGVRLVDLLALSCRSAASAEIEAVLGGGEVRGFDSALLVNGGVERPVRIGIAPIHDGLAIGGAMVTLSPSAQSH